MSAKHETSPLVLTLAQFDLDTVGDKGTFDIPPGKFRVLRAGVLVTSTDAGGGTVAFDKRPTYGSDTGRGNGDVASITIPASNQQGKFIYEPTQSSVTLVPGNQVVVEVLTDPGAGATMIPYLVLAWIPETAANMSNMVSGT